MFVRGTDNQLWHKWWDGLNWSGWEPLGGVLTSGPAVAASGANRLDVFVRGTDSQLWHAWWDGTQWNGWQPLGGVLTSGPAAASWGNGRLDVVAEGTDKQLWHRSFDGTQWSGWEPLGGQMSGDPGVSAWGPGRLDVFIRNTDGTLGHRHLDGGQWSGWEWFAAALSTGPAAVSANPGQVDVVWPGSASVLQRFEYNGAWQNAAVTGRADVVRPVPRRTRLHSRRCLCDRHGRTAVVRFAGDPAAIVHCPDGFAGTEAQSERHGEALMALGRRHRPLLRGSR